MTLSHRPLRSALYIPGSKPRALEKARNLPTDSIIFDLEDAVSAESKSEARVILHAALAQGGYGARLKIVRINALNTPWGEADLQALDGLDVDAVLLPKVNSAGDLDALANVVEAKWPLWAMLETPLGILNAGEIAAHPLLQALVAGTNDLAKDLKCQLTLTRDSLQMALQALVLAARAHDVALLDGVYNQFQDEEGLIAQCRQGRSLGFDGKTLIHPAQLSAANRCFAPSADEIELAQRQISAFEEAEAAGQGVAVLDGTIIENLHIETARKTLAMAQAIAAMQTE
ncbi:CoA ester lyase [Rhodobacteraceae bacterium IMCC15231]|nr:CoA ester lyase [Rhodobacteraceae bacterium IMCC15231]